jgi:hypothetical protein
MVGAAAGAAAESARATAGRQAMAAKTAAGQSRLLQGFETQSDLASFEVDNGPAALAQQHATQGKACARVPANAYLRFFQLPQDWSGFDALEVDLYCDTSSPLSLYVLIGDAAWQAKSTYWNRYNGTFSLRPERNTVSIPLGGLYRGEVGSRYNDLKTSIDPAAIVRLDLGFTPADNAAGSIYVDNLRLTRWSRPKSIQAFDFGPEGQSLAPGFTAVSPDTVYSDKPGYGWDPGPRPGRAWDVTFPSRLLQDSIDFQDATFRVKLAPGRYRVLVFFESLGYWSGEQAQFTRREIFGRNWKTAEDHGEWGKLDHIYHFQDTEPLPGADLWDAYMSYLFRPLVADVQVGSDGFDLRVSADGANARRVAGLILYPKGDAAADQWAVDAFFQQRDEFRARAVELPLPQTPNPAPITEADKARGYLLFVPSVEDTVYFSTLPAAGQVRSALETFATPGEMRALTLGIRPLKDLGKATLAISDLTGPAGAIPADSVTISVVRHLPTRSLEGLMYRITPRYLAKASQVKLPGGLTRQLWLTLRVPKEARPGQYRGVFTMRFIGAPAVEAPITLRVLPFTLPESDFLCGFIGIEPDVPLTGDAYDALQRQVFAIFLERGFTSFTGGPAIEFTGLDQAGKPILDFGAADRFLAEAKQAGYHREFNNYGGLVVRGLYDSYDYTKGETGAALEAKYGLPYEEIMRRVFAAVEAHANEQGWLPFSYHLCDETRTVEKAREQLEFMRLLKRASPWLRTTGSYSVSFAPTEDPLELALQGFFGALDISMLNNHDELVMAKARELGKKVYLYNQGHDRYPFGLYQWSERAKGIGGRYEWIAFIRHGYEYFDLDGREPDPSAIFFASEGLRPSLMLERCAEGLNDFRYLQALDSCISEVGPSSPEALKQAAAEARAFLSGLSDRIAINQRGQPAWLDLDAVRAEAARRIEELQALSGPGRTPTPAP